MQKGEKSTYVYKLFVPLNKKIPIIIIFIIGLFVFSNMFFNGFVWDDKTYITNNLEAHKVDLISSLGSNNYSLFNASGQYRPLSLIYFSIFYSLFGNNSFFYHLSQLFLHIFSSILAYLIFRKFLEKGLALLLAIIFLVHPMNVESVSYIAHSDNPIFILFGFISLLFIMKKDLNYQKLVFSFLLLLLSLLTRETGILFLFLAFFYIFLFERKHLVKFSIGVPITLFIYIFIRLVIGHIGLSNRFLVPIASLPLTDRLLNIPSIIFYYLKTFFFPLTLVIDQQWVIPSVSFSTFTFPLLIDALFFTFLGLGVVFLHRQRNNRFKPYIFFCAWFAVGLLFHIQIFPLDKTVSDHWFYFTMVGLVGLLGTLYQNIENRFAKYRKISISLAIILILFLSLRTIVRNTNWQNAILLFTHDRQFSDNYDLENELSVEYLNNREYAKSLESIDKSIALRPNELNLLNKCVIYINLGYIQKAQHFCDLALHAKDYNTYFPHKHNILLYTDYSPILIFYNNPAVAEDFIQQAIRDYPDASGLWYFLALSRDRLNDKQGALDAAQKAYELNPTQANLYIYNHLLYNQPFHLGFYGKSITF